MGYLPARSNGGVPEVGYPPSRGTPQLDLAVVPPGPGYPPSVDRQMDGQTRVKTLPSRRTTYAVGNNNATYFRLEGGM